LEASCPLSSIIRRKRHPRQEDRPQSLRQPGPVRPATPPASSAAPSLAPKGTVDVAAIMDKIAGQSKDKLDWRHSIVDLMKLLDLDSSLAARKTLAQELHYTGNTNDSATMNVWLHKQVMAKLAENGGKVPDELKH
jgi:hypothetical protein